MIQEEGVMMRLPFGKTIEKSVFNTNYNITNDCIGCGICTRVCPAGCIHLDGQLAVNTGENCQACYACIQACPKMAIQFGDILLKEPNPNARYRNPNITLTELVQANDQTII